MYTRHKRWRTFIFFIFFLLINYSISSGQSNYGSIEGLVLNLENKPLVGANIILTNLERGTTTNDQGELLLLNFQRELLKCRWNLLDTDQRLKM